MYDICNPEGQVCSPIAFISWFNFCRLGNLCSGRYGSLIHTSATLASLEHAMASNEEGTATIPTFVTACNGTRCTRDQANKKTYTRQISKPNVGAGSFRSWVSRKDNTSGCTDKEVDYTDKSPADEVNGATYLVHVTTPILGAFPVDSTRAMFLVIDVQRRAIAGSPFKFLLRPPLLRKPVPEQSVILPNDGGGVVGRQSHIYVRVRSSTGDVCTPSTVHLTAQVYREVPAVTTFDSCQVKATMEKISSSDKHDNNSLDVTISPSEEVVGDYVASFTAPSSGVFYISITLSSLDCPNAPLSSSGNVSHVKGSPMQLTFVDSLPFALHCLVDGLGYDNRIPSTGGGMYLCLPLIPVHANVKEATSASGGRRSYRGLRPLSVLHKRGKFPKSGDRLKTDLDWPHMVITLPATDRILGHAVKLVGSMLTVVAPTIVSASEQLFRGKRGRLQNFPKVQFVAATRSIALIVSNLCGGCVSARCINLCCVKQHRTVIVQNTHLEDSEELGVKGIVDVSQTTQLERSLPSSFRAWGSKGDSFSSLPESSSSNALTELHSQGFIFSLSEIVSLGVADGLGFWCSSQQDFTKTKLEDAPNIRKVEFSSRRGPAFYPVFRNCSLPHSLPPPGHSTRLGVLEARAILFKFVCDQYNISCRLVHSFHCICECHISQSKSSSNIDGTLGGVSRAIVHSDNLCPCPKCSILHAPVLVVIQKQLSVTRFSNQGLRNF